MKYGVWYLGGKYEAGWCDNSVDLPLDMATSSCQSWERNSGGSGQYEVRPYGASKFEVLAEKIGKIVTEKNAAYGSSNERSGKILAILYPDGVKPEQYTDMLLVARILDKLSRIATDKDALGEDPFLDVAGYGICGAALRSE